jgi:hypothetical protein
MLVEGFSEARRGGAEMSGRRLILKHADGSEPFLLEDPAKEEYLQEFLRDHPDLIPMDEYGMTGPALVVGRETRVPSGAVDLVLLSREGSLILVEFKIGPENPDFRAALSQLLDYGSDLWGKTYEEFEDMVARRFFNGPWCPATSPTKGLTTIKAAAEVTWEGFSESASAAFHDKLSGDLRRGAFHYIVATQRFTETTINTVKYLNAEMPRASFYLAELIRFSGDDVSAIEIRTVFNPAIQTTGQPRARVDEAEFLNLFPDQYRQTLESFFNVCRGNNLGFFYGARGLSVRLPAVGPNVSVAWVFPPGISGWNGLTDVTLGYATDQAARAAPSIVDALANYLTDVSALPGARKVGASIMKAYGFDEAGFLASYDAIVEAIGKLAQAVQS